MQSLQEKTVTTGKAGGAGLIPAGTKSGAGMTRRRLGTMIGGAGVLGVGGVLAACGAPAGSGGQEKASSAAKPV